MKEADIYQAADGWRWRLKADNGEIVAESGESYTERNDAAEGFARVVALLEADEGTG